MAEQTLLMVKPDAVERGLAGRILARIEAEGFALQRLKLVRLSPAAARRFYAVHEGRPFLDALVDYMSSGPVCVVVLEREDAIARLRALVGATDPTEAAPGTIRREFGIDKRHNAVHASDGPQTAAAEIAFFGLTLDREGGV
ncbi:MAG: nucleoside-diphosphate kinase [Candidatus Eisenbacteria bacterium]